MLTDRALCQRLGADRLLAGDVTLQCVLRKTGGEAEPIDQNISKYCTCKISTTVLKACHLTCVKHRVVYLSQTMVRFSFAPDSIYTK